MKEWDNQLGQLQKNLCTLYQHLWSACEPQLVAKLERHARWTTVDNTKDTLALLGLIDKICSSTTTIQYGPEQLACAINSLATFNGTNIDLETYHTLFKEKLRILEEFELDLGTPQMGEAVYRDAEKRWGGYDGRNVKLLDMTKRKKAARDQVAAQLFLKNCGKQYESTQKLFSTEYSQKRYNKFPRDITDMATYLSDIEPERIPRQNNKSNDKNDADQNANNNNQQQKGETNNSEENTKLKEYYRTNVCAEQCGFQSGG